MEQVHAAVEEANVRAEKADVRAFRAERRAEAAEKALATLRAGSEDAEHRIATLEDLLRTARLSTAGRAKAPPPVAAKPRDDGGMAARITQTEGLLVAARQQVLELEHELAQLKSERVLSQTFVVPSRSKAAGTVAAAAVATVAGNRGAVRAAMSPEQCAKVDEELLLAANHDDSVGCVEELLRGADPNVRGEKGITALHLASCTGSVHTVRVLLASGADVHAVCDEQSTPMSLAEQLTDPAEVVDLLVAKGAVRSTPAVAADEASLREGEGEGEGKGENSQ
jgi:hypothetical protein